MNELFERYGPNGDNASAMLEGFADAAPRYNQELWRLFERAVGRRVLEVGAGIGTFTEKLRQNCDLVVATDLSPAQVERLRQRFVLRDNVLIELLDLNDISVERLRSFRLDTIFCSNVLEHVRDDRGALDRLRQATEPGATLLLFVPAHQVLYGRIDRELGHYRRYESEVLRGLLGATGWTIESMRPFNLIGAIGWLANGRWLRQRVLSRAQLAFYDRVFAPLLRLEQILDVPFGCSLAVVASRSD